MSELTMKKMFRPVVIGVQSLHPGDAVSNDVIGMCNALEAIGVDVRLFPSDYAIEIGKQVINMKSVPDFLGDKGLFIYHFCVKWEPANELMFKLRCPRIVKYHNITPGTFFRGISQRHEKACDDSRRVIEEVVHLTDYLWADSLFNAGDFERHGFPASRIQILPPFHHTERLLDITPDKDWMNQLNDGRINVLFVGRLAPNKNHSLLIESFAVFKQRIPHARLLIGGGCDAELASYKMELDNRVASLGLRQDILFCGKVPDEVLSALYRSASLFAITSLHEGFCVPLLEAMAFGVPIAALSRCAVPETAQNIAEYCEDEDAEAFSSAMSRALDADRAMEFRRLGRQHYWARFSQHALEGRFLDAITPLLGTSVRSVRAIHQFHSGSAVGDAITNAMLFTQELLRCMGFESQIYVEHIAPELKNVLKPHTLLRPAKDVFVLVHHSMGHDLDRFIASLAGRGALVYHNITPAIFFPDNTGIQAFIEKGLAQLDQFRSHFDSASAVSSFNAQQLRSRDFRHVEVIPILLDLDKLANRPWNDALVQSQASMPTILFVGRIVPNKCPHELVDIAAELRCMTDGPFQVILVGSFDPNDAYCRDIQNRILRQGLEHHVRFTGKISDADLTAWFRAADVLVTLSEHEGFCVPVVEAMAYDVPVVAFDAGALRETLRGEGILLNRKDSIEIAALIKLLLTDRPFRRALIRGQRTRLMEFGKEVIRNRLAGFLRRLGMVVPPSGSVRPCATGASLPTYQVEGPFETSYSLALVNREIAKALNGLFPGEVGLFATEGPGDYQPDSQLVDRLPVIRELQEKGRKGARPQVCIRNLYPPRVADMDGIINILNLAWEESELPYDWVWNFNRSLDGIAVVSEFVRKVLIDNGVSVPSIVAGNGVDHIADITATPLNASMAGQLKDRFVFLHVSSCFPRKGVDLLLDAYGRTFTANDAVVLVIKTFPNPHNVIEEMINSKKAENANFPPLLLINRDLSDNEMVALYKSANALVAPSRGEGFGLPMAEAMFFGIPVITTAYGGQSDFCTPETAWLIDFKFAPASTHLGLFNSVWIEPSVSHLSSLLRHVYNGTESDIFSRCEIAKKMIQKKFTWKKCAERMVMLKNNISRTPPFSDKTIHVAWVSTWNTKCGVAEYSSHLIEHFTQERIKVTILAPHAKEMIRPDEKNVIRCWTDYRQPVDDLLEQLSILLPDVLILQFNFSFISQKELSRLIDFCEVKNIATIIEFHSTKDVRWGDLLISLSESIKYLNKADRLIVHSIDDLNRLKNYGSYLNSALFPHGVLDWLPEPDTRQNNRLELGLHEDDFVIASYGFLLPHKGLSELVEAFSIVRETCENARLFMLNALYPDPVSEQLHAHLLDKIAAHLFPADISIITEYLEDEIALQLLNAADLIVFPYMETAESVSGAVRHGLLSQRPVLCTPLTIFSDLSSVVHYATGTGIPEIAASIIDLINDPICLKSKTNEQNRWLDQHRYSIMGMRLNGLVTGLLNNRNTSSCGH